MCEKTFLSTEKQVVFSAPFFHAAENKLITLKKGQSSSHLN
jgi:hypothetical protein